MTCHVCTVIYRLTGLSCYWRWMKATILVKPLRSPQRFTFCIPTVSSLYPQKKVLFRLFCLQMLRQKHQGQEEGCEQKTLEDLAKHFLLKKKRGSCCTEVFFTCFCNNSVGKNFCLVLFPAHWFHSAGWALTAYSVPQQPKMKRKMNRQLQMKRRKINNKGKGNCSSCTGKPDNNWRDRQRKAEKCSCTFTAARRQRFPKYPATENPFLHGNENHLPLCDIHPTSRKVIYSYLSHVKTTVKRTAKQNK